MSWASQKQLRSLTDSQLEGFDYETEISLLEKTECSLRALEEQLLPEFGHVGSEIKTIVFQLSTARVEQLTESLEFGPKSKATYQQLEGLMQEFVTKAQEVLPIENVT